MINILEGLEKIGYKVENIKIDMANNPANNKESSKPKEKVFDINEYIFQKPYECPICYRKFTSPTVRTGKVRLASIDYDLRPIYESIEPLFYDVVMCNNCGYAAVTQKFTPLSDSISSMVQSFLATSFKPMPTVESIDINIAISRYKAALLCAIKRNAKNGEQAFICLKLTWLYRILGDREKELSFMALAHKGFKTAYSTESMPICGINAFTIMFLLAAFSKTLGNYDEALKLLSGLIVDRGATTNIRERARDMRDEINSILMKAKSK